MIMMVIEAYNILKNKYPDMVVVECLEFSTSYAFALCEKGTENELRGGGYYTVDKITGKIGVFSPVNDFESFFAAKNINIDIFK